MQDDDGTVPRQPSTRDDSQCPPKIYIMIENPSKSNNLGPILRCGAAYSATFIFIGYDKCAVDGSHGAHKHVEILCYPTFPQAVQHIKNFCGVGSIVGILGDVTFPCDDDDFKGDELVRTVCHDVHSDKIQVTSTTPMMQTSKSDAVNDLDSSISRRNTSLETHDEIMTKNSYPPTSTPIHLRPFVKQENICFLITKRTPGLPVAQGIYCDAFVHISTGAPMLSSSGTTQAIYGLLDCQTCLSICLHHFAAFAGYQERHLMGQKFQVEKIHGVSAAAAGGGDGWDRDECFRVRNEERRRQRLQAEKDAQEAWDNGEIQGALFG